MSRIRERALARTIRSAHSIQVTNHFVQTSFAGSVLRSELEQSFTVAL
jgi:hypothetical protein